MRGLIISIGVGLGCLLLLTIVYLTNQLSATRITLSNVRAQNNRLARDLEMLRASQKSPSSSSDTGEKKHLPSLNLNLRPLSSSLALWSRNMQPAPPPAFESWVQKKEHHRNPCTYLMPFEEAWTTLLPLQRMQQEEDETGFLSWASARAMQELITPYLLATPAPLTVTTRPIPLELNCANPDFADLLTGKKREEPLRIFDVTTVGFDMDGLEMRLWELSDVVDMTVVLEATYTHRGQRKALFYEQSRDRFMRFHNRNILHFIDDDVAGWSFTTPETGYTGDVAKKGYVEDWDLDDRTKRLVWVRMAEALGELRPDDLIIWGDMDEIPDYLVLHHVKHCETRSNAIPFKFTTPHVGNTFWFKRPMAPWGKPIVVSRANLTTSGHGWPPSKEPWINGAYQTSYRGRGGHVSNFGTVVRQIFKRYAMAEGPMEYKKAMQWLKEPWTHLKNLLSKGYPFTPADTIEKPYNEAHRGDVMSEEEFQKSWKPWIVKANPERYPHLLSKTVMTTILDACKKQ